MAFRIDYGVPTNRCAIQLRLGIEKGFHDEGLETKRRLTQRPILGDQSSRLHLHEGHSTMSDDLKFQLRMTLSDEFA
jgi:hypothetical protein